MFKPKIVFDFDQTLAYRDGMWSATILEILQEHGHTQIDIEDIRKYIQTGFLWDNYEKSHKELLKDLSWWEYHEEFVKRILLSNNLDEQEAIRLSKFIREKYINPTKWFLFPETLNVLKELNGQGYECYILSNHVPELENLVIGLGIETLIAKIYNSAFIGYEKPNTHIYRYMIDDLKSSPSDIIMIGDNYISDVVGARSNGIHSILVKTENTKNYRYYSRDLAGVKAIIEQIELNKRSARYL